MGWIKKILFYFFSPEDRKPTKRSEKKKKSKIEKWQEYAEKLVIESGIDLDNVLVHSHGGWGLCGPKAYQFENYHVTYKSEELGNLKFPLPLPDKPYIAVPEITGWWEFRAWVHEIGHYTHKHYDDRDKPRFMKEYEAEKFCLEKCKESGVVGDYDMIDIKFSAVGYLDSHIDKAIEKGNIKCYADIPEEVIEFLHQCEYMKNELKRKFLAIEEKYFESQKKFDRYYR